MLLGIDCATQTSDQLIVFVSCVRALPIGTPEVEQGHTFAGRKFAGLNSDDSALDRLACTRDSLALRIDCPHGSRGQVAQHKQLRVQVVFFQYYFVFYF